MQAYAHVNSTGAKLPYSLVEKSALHQQFAI